MKNKEAVCDVLVAGAGVAGCCAAIAAGRAGAKTILLEAGGFPGGTAVAIRHRHLCGLYPQNSGLPREILRGLTRFNPKSKFVRIGKLRAFYFYPQNLESVLRQLLNHAPNLTVKYNCPVTGVKREGSLITAVNAKQGKSRLIFKPGALIDATGGGKAIEFSGARYELSPKKSRQLAGFTFEVRELNDREGLLPIKVPYSLSLAEKNKKIFPYLRFSSFAYGQIKNSGVIKVNIPAQDKPQGERQARKYANLVNNSLRKTLPEFGKARISWVSAGIHDREGLRLAGEYTLTGKDVLGARKFPDAIAKGCWPVESWDQENGQKITYLKEKAFYEIPFRSIKSSDTMNLFAAGRCISADPQAIASSRVTGTCMYIGEAVGKKAAFFFKR